MNSMLNNWPIDPAVVIIALGVITFFGIDRFSVNITDLFDLHYGTVKKSDPQV